MIDFTGQTIGKLQVLHSTFCRDGKNMYWKCLCSCGKEVEVSSIALKKGKGQNTCECSRYSLIGKRFGRLLVLRKTTIKNKISSYWVCVCDCGNEKIASTGSLQRQRTKSCGCLKREMTIARNIKHQQTHTRLYEIWKNMNKRCKNTSDKSYKNYGGRGISVCTEWCKNFVPFFNWAMANGYSDKLTIERINVNGNYEPTNCKWATKLEQANNTRNNRFINVNGISKTVAQWSREIKGGLPNFCREFSKKGIDYLISKLPPPSDSQNWLKVVE